MKIIFLALTGLLINCVVYSQLAPQNSGRDGSFSQEPSVNRRATENRIPEGSYFIVDIVYCVIMMAEKTMMFSIFEEDVKRSAPQLIAVGRMSFSPLKLKLLNQ